MATTTNNKHRLALIVLSSLALVSWLLALGGVAAGTAYACALGGVGGRGRRASAAASAAAEGGGGADAGPFGGALSALFSGDDISPVITDDGSSSSGLRRSRQLLASPASPPDLDCGSGFRMPWWSLAFHALAWLAAARAALAASGADPAVLALRASPLSPLMAVALAYATWCATSDLASLTGGVGGGSILQGLASALDALMMAALPGRRAAAQAAAAGWVLLGACDLAFCLATVCAAEARAVATVNQPPPPSAVYVYSGAGAAAVAAKQPAPAAAIAAKSEAAAAAARDEADAAEIGTGV